MMNNNTHFEGPTDPRRNPQNLARWLSTVFTEPPQNAEQPSTATPDDSSLALQYGSDYHLRFYQQLPDFVMALLSHDPQATTHYAPLLYHLAACHECHQSYLELYDAMYAAMNPRGARPILGQGTRTLQATPQRMLGHLCQTLISQAEALLLQGRRKRRDTSDQARSLLQLAIKISASIGQSSIRRQSLRDLVRVATLFAGPDSPRLDSPAAHSYTPVLAGSGGMRGRKALRGHGTLERSSELDQPEIILQARSLEGRIVQHGDSLELHLRGLEPALRGHFVTIAVALGSLLEPVRWRGGNPNTIRSTAPVDDTGKLVTPLGETSLRLSNQEERNMLETMFLLLEVRPAD